MKKIKILGLAVLLFAMTACEDWLDVDASNQVDRNELFNSELGYAEALTGVYAKMCDGSLYGREMTFHVLDIMAGYYPSIMYQHSSWYQYAYAQADDAYGQSYCKPYIEAMWNGLYAQVANLNSLLATIDGNRGVFSDDNYSLIKGEALGLRAFLHFDLLRLFAEAYATGKDKESIPYVTTLTPAVTPLFTQTDAVEAMLEDLKQAKALMANDPMCLGTAPSACLAPLPSGDYLSSDKIPSWHNRRFRFNYYAVVATMARVYLWKGDKENALVCAKEVIAAQESAFPWVLEKNLKNVGGKNARNQDRTFATEHIFALNVTDLEELMDTYIYDGAVGTGGMNMNTLEIYANEISDLYENLTADYRYQYNAFVTNANSYMGGRFVAKFYQRTSCARYFQERLPLIRLSEMYYIAAECTTDTGDGVDYLEEVRSHRGLTSFPLNRNMSRVDLEKEIRKEYRKELIGEGQLWYYYKRLQQTDFNPNMTDLKFFTFEIPDLEQANAGRQ